jgi:hypothetical protein
LSRRDLLIAWLQALFLTLCPWLRSEDGLEKLHVALDRALPDTARAIFKGGTFKISMAVKGFEVPDDLWAKIVWPLGIVPEIRTAPPRE